MKNNIKNIITLLFVTTLFFAHVSCNSSDKYVVYEAIPQTETGKKLVEGTDLFAMISSDITYNLSDGVEVTEVKYLSEKGLAMKLFVFEIDLTKGSTIVASTPDDKPNYGMQEMTIQAAKRDNATNPVWGGINGDFYNMTTGMPQGIVYKNGLAIKTTFADAICTFFAIKKDGLAVVGDQDLYATMSGDIKEAISGRVILMSNGTTVAQTSAALEPRTAIGVSEDGKTVYMLVVDGRNFHYSNGMSYEELGKCFYALGAYNAINLDGGGSSTFFIRKTPDFVDDRFQIRNWPTDNGGKERNVANGLLIIEK